MIVYHDTRPCTPRGHSAYVGYDVYVGKVESLGLRRNAGRAFACPQCSAWFGTGNALSAHLVAKHGARG